MSGFGAIVREATDWTADGDRTGKAFAAYRSKCGCRSLHRIQYPSRPRAAPITHHDVPPAILASRMRELAAKTVLVQCPLVNCCWEFKCFEHQVHPVGDVILLQQSRDVKLHRAFGNVQLCCDLLVAQILCN